MSKTNRSVAEYIYKLDIPFSRNKYKRVKNEFEKLLVSPIKAISLLVTVAGIFALLFEVKYFSNLSGQIYIVRLAQTIISFSILVFSFLYEKKKHQVFIIHILLSLVVIVSAIMVILIPSTFQFNSQIAGLIIFTSSLFLSWEVKNQIIVAIYYNAFSVSAIFLSNTKTFITANFIESVIYVLFLGLFSIIASAVNFKMRMELAEKSFIIEESEKKFRSLFDNSTEGIFQMDINGKFITANPSLIKIFDFDSFEDIIKNNIDIAFLTKHFEESGEVKNYRFNLKKKDGREVVVSLNAKMIYDEDKKFRFYEGNMRDITKEVLLERERLAVVEALRIEKEKSDCLANEAIEVSKIKSDFLAYMSHEIRLPINGVLGYLEIVEQEAYNDKSDLMMCVKKATSSANSLLNFMNNILDISKIEACRMELEEINFSLREVLTDAISTVDSLVLDKSLKIKSNIENNIPLILIGDPDRLRQIFINFLSNAIKFTQEGEILINISLLKITDHDATIFASVKDTGIGISKEQLNMLFEAYSQADKSYKRIYGGTGLGLRICKEFIHMMDGEISVESEEGKGSEFRFTAKFKITNELLGYSSMK
ncbi:MAG: ATP-binding protein [Ignavibacteriales bacterium]|nr:ATP-binding protein [Ignavibacteriales bacterium]